MSTLRRRGVPVFKLATLAGVTADRRAVGFLPSYG